MKLEAFHKDSDTIYFDWRFHRNPAELYPQFSDSLTYIQLYQGNPIIVIDKGLMTTPNVNTSRSGRYRLDFQLAPYLEYQLGDFRDPFETQWGLSPRIQWNLIGRLYGVMQWYFPFQNDFQEDIGRTYRPGEVGVGYDYIFKGRHGVSVYAGIMDSRHYGMHLQYTGRSRSDRWMYGGSLFIGGDFVYDNTLAYITPANQVSGDVFLAYRYAPLGLTMKGSLEMYLDQSVGAKGEMLRQFGNTDVGFFAVLAQGGGNGGFMVRFPLWPGRIYHNMWMQVRTSHTYAFRYNLRTTSTTPQIRRYQYWFDELLRFHPDYIKGQLGE